MNKIIILPLDNKSTRESLEIAPKVSGLVWGFKLRRQILENGIDIINYFKAYGNVMVDFKLYDIPSAINETVKLFVNTNADIITVHCTADWSPVNLNLNKIAGVTILTSKSHASFSLHYKGSNIQDMVNQMASEAELHNYGYIVCSPLH